MVANYLLERKILTTRNGALHARPCAPGPAPEKALSPIEVSVAGSVTLVSEAQSSNALLPTVVTPAGIVTAVSPVPARSPRAPQPCASQQRCRTGQHTHECVPAGTRSWRGLALFADADRPPDCSQRPPSAAALQARVYAKGRVGRMRRAHAHAGYAGRDAASHTRCAAAPHALCTRSAPALRPLCARSAPAVRSLLRPLL